MSDPSIMIGYIDAIVPRDLADAARRMNDAVLAGLPETDQAPPLTRALFAVTGEGWQQGTLRGQRLIHFGGIFNYFGEDLEQWLDKFEGLLRRLYWYRAEVLTLSGYVRPSVRIRYKAEAARRQYRSDEPTPPQSWEIEVTELRDDVGPTNEYIGEWVESIRARAGPRPESGSESESGTQ